MQDSEPNKRLTELFRSPTYYYKAEGRWMVLIRCFNPKMEDGVSLNTERFTPKPMVQEQTCRDRNMDEHTCVHTHVRIHACTHGWIYTYGQTHTTQSHKPTQTHPYPHTTHTHLAWRLQAAAATTCRSLQLCGCLAHRRPLAGKPGFLVSGGVVIANTQRHVTLCHTHRKTV